MGHGRGRTQDEGQRGQGGCGEVTGVGVVGLEVRERRAGSVFALQTLKGRWLHCVCDPSTGGSEWRRAVL